MNFRGGPLESRSARYYIDKLITLLVGNLEEREFEKINFSVLEHPIAKVFLINKYLELAIAYIDYPRLLLASFDSFHILIYIYWVSQLMVSSTLITTCRECPSCCRGVLLLS